MAKQTVLTSEGLKKLEEELDELKSVKRREVAEKIKIALGYGDLSENSEYDEAKNEQGLFALVKLGVGKRFLNEFGLARFQKSGKEINRQFFLLSDTHLFFLVFCKKLHNKEEIDQAFRDSLALIISRSCFGDDDAEL